VTPALVDWLYDAAMPLWLEHGVDWQAGAFHESLDPRDLVCRADFRRLYIAARQVYVFAQAENRGLDRAAEAAELGLDFLANHARQPDGGYAKRFDLANNITDPTRDLYDLAFVLFALAKSGRPQRCRVEALHLMGLIDRVLADSSGGWREADPRRLPRRQNPHMHLLEAVLAAHETFGEPVFLNAAHRLARLALDRFVQPEGGLPEYYDAVMTCLRDSSGRYLTEPGHHYEWSWLLARYRPHADAETGQRLDGAARVLIAFADRHGLSARDNAAVDEVYSDGEVRQASAKLWPQTERLKAILAWPGYSSASVATVVAGLAAYTDGLPSGCWQERRAAAGDFIAQPMQAGSLYHLTCAIEELDRMGG
jgi:mannose/cellobiose epimerase-like protein (N-acyl-D-glucosamine 2-epimerase family)